MKSVPRAISVLAATASLATTTLLPGHPASANVRPSAAATLLADTRPRAVVADSPEPSAEPAPSESAVPSAEPSAGESPAMSSAPEVSAPAESPLVLGPLAGGAAVRPHAGPPRAVRSPAGRRFPQIARIPRLRPPKIRLPVQPPGALPSRAAPSGVSPFAPATPFDPTLPALPGLPKPGEAAAMPQIAPSASPTPAPAASQGISELTTFAPAGALRAGRISWATLVGIAIVGESGLLWLFAGLTMWRRRRGGRVRPTRPRRISIPRILR